MTHGQPDTNGANAADHAPPPPRGPAGPGSRAPEPGLTPRLVLAAVLLIVALTGIGATTPGTSWGAGPWHDHGLPLGIGLELVLAGALAALHRQRRRRPDAGQPAQRLRRVLRPLLILGLLTGAGALLLNGIGNLASHPRRSISRSKPARLPAPRLHAAGHGGGFHPVVLLYGLLAVAVLMGILAAVIVARRRAEEDRDEWRDDGADLADDDPAQQLRRAVQSGRAALGEVDDARKAIIACYAAMELSLASAGAVRGAAETPDELLAKADQAGLVSGGEAARLTALFYEARFSTHPLPPAAREQARQALDQLAASLGRRAERLARAAQTASASEPAGRPAE